MLSMSDGAVSLGWMRRRAGTASVDVFFVLVCMVP